MRRIGLMGGTFDPIHLGHLIAAEAARDAEDLDEVWFIPTSVPAHKPQPGASGAHRLAMVEAALRDNPAFRPQPIELQRGGVSYTIDTVTDLQELYPGTEFFWIVGSDMREDLPNWRRIEDLAARVSFISLERPDVSNKRASGSEPRFLLERIKSAAMPPIGISSTSIRQRVQAGQSIRYWVTETVREYIERNDLYGSGSPS